MLGDHLRLVDFLDAHVLQACGGVSPGQVIVSQLRRDPFGGVDGQSCRLMVVVCIGVEAIVMALIETAH